MTRYDPTLVDLISNIFVLCTNVKVYLYTGNYKGGCSISGEGVQIYKGGLFC